MCLTPLYTIIFLIVISIIFKNQIIELTNFLSIYISQNPLFGILLLLGVIIYITLFLILSNWDGIKEKLRKTKKSS